MANIDAVLKLVIFTLSAQLLSPPWSASTATLKEASDIIGIPVYAAADESTSVIGRLADGENPTPVAESRGAGGIRWYLVKTKSGVVGWLKHTENEQSKNVADFFRSLPAERVSIAIEPRARSTAANQSGAVTVPVTVNGRAVIVPVTFNRSVNANLLLDTGASMTMISRRVATALALSTTGAALLSGIGGTVSAPIARIESVQVGDVEVTGMAVSVHDISRPAQFEGLLGMDFLGRFQVSVDSAKKLLVLTPK